MSRDYDRARYPMAAIKPIATTLQRNVAGRILPANRPPRVPPIIDPPAITSITGQTTCPENTKRIAAATLMINPSACLSALSRV